MRRRKDRVDENQRDIVKKLRSCPGVTVVTGHDDLLVGYRGITYWIELKDPEKTKSKKNGKLLSGALKDSQKDLLKNFTGQYDIVFTAEEILEIIGYAKE